MTEVEGLLAKAPSSYLEDDNGNKSAVRAMSFISLLAAIAFAWLVVTGRGDSANGMNIVYGFLIAAFAPKVVQKFAEGKP